MIGERNGHVKIRKAIQNVEIRMLLGGYWSLKVIGKITIRQSAYDFLFDFNRNYTSILYHVQVIMTSFLSKVPILTCPTCIWHPHSNFAKIFGVVCAIKWCCFSDSTFSSLDTILPCDRQTDRKTDT